MKKIIKMPIFCASLSFTVDVTRPGRYLSYIQRDNLSGSANILGQVVVYFHNLYRPVVRCPIVVYEQCLQITMPAIWIR